MEQEIWKELIYHGENFGDTYEISNTGRLKNIKLNKILHPTINRQGYLMQVISRRRKRNIAIKIHRAVAENFVVGDKTLVINHKDCNKLNNHADNLEFVTNSYNVIHSNMNGCKKTMFTENDIKSIRKMRAHGKTYKEIASAYKCNTKTVYKITKHITYTYY